MVVSDLFILRPSSIFCSHWRSDLLVVNQTLSVAESAQQADPMETAKEIFF